MVVDPLNVNSLFHPVLVRLLVVEISLEVNF